MLNELHTRELEKPTAEETERDFSAMMDSVNLINELEAKESLNEDEHCALNCNKQHLRIMLEREHIAEDSRDKSAFEAASK